MLPVQDCTASSSSSSSSGRKGFKKSDDTDGIHSQGGEEVISDILVAAKRDG